MNTDQYRPKFAFSHPDYTVGSGIYTGSTSRLAGFTAGQELKDFSFAPCPKGQYSILIPLIGYHRDSENATHHGTYFDWMNYRSEEESFQFNCCLNYFNKCTHKAA